MRAARIDHAVGSDGQTDARRDGLYREAVEAHGAALESPSQLSLGLEAAPVLTREAFVVSASNAAAVRALDGFPDVVGGVLALVGPRGSGKTHLLTSWAERTGAVLLAGEAAATADLGALQGRLVALDDAAKADDETLFHLFNMAGEAGAGLVLAARQPPAVWEVELPDLRSRLNAVRVALISEPDDAVLRGMLQRFFAEVAVKPSTDLLEYLVRRIERSVPEARETVRRLIEVAAPTHRPVTRALARTVLETETKSGDLPF
ncbi:MAG: chromosomal replication initiator DnaA [Caulobacteraceae bacterium]|nr:chromosomal replication initiator DnaA [Caulobacteraceae bacterium]